MTDKHLESLHGVPVSKTESWIKSRGFVVRGTAKHPRYTTVPPWSKLAYVDWAGVMRLVETALGPRATQQQPANERRLGRTVASRI